MAKASVCLVFLSVGLFALLIVVDAPRRPARADDPEPPCGTERWSVKTGTDPDVGTIDLSNPLYGSINRLCHWPRPHTLPSNNRIAPFETRAYVVMATLKQYILESDGDYHLVLKDDLGNSLIGEIPSPVCVANSSPFKPWITNARAEFDSAFRVTTSWHYTNTPVIVMGVAFFDFAHGQTGHAPNYVELHPVLDVQFP
jgi:hypothetical protein